MTDTLLTVNDLRKEYSTSEGSVTAVDGVSFEVGEGEIVGLLGPNGAGKTTTIKCILGLVEPSSGTVSVEGIDPSEDPRAAYREVGAVLEGARNVYWRLTVRENFRFFTGLQGESPNSATDAHEELLSKLDLESKADEPVRNLSRGMKQKVSIGCALARDTSTVFLDEPTLGLDVEASRDLRTELRRLVEQESRTVVLSSHDMDVVQEVCDRLIIMSDGEVVVDDTVDNLMSLFQTQAYRFTVDREPDAAALDGFDVEFDSDGTDVVEFEATLDDSDRLYDLMSALEANDVAVEDIESVEPDLEDIFLEVTDRGAKTEVEA